MKKKKKPGQIRKKIIMGLRKNDENPAAERKTV